MSMRDEELERIVREASAREPVPEFERVWRRAQAGAGRGGLRGGALRWALGPVLAAVSIAVVVVAARGVPVRDEPVARGVRKGSGPLVAVADAGAGTARAEEATQGEVKSKPEAEGLYVAGTDFLLEMEIPAWN
jgi:hypothetical protein